MYKHNVGPEKAFALSVIIAHSWAPKVIANSRLGVSRCSQNFRAASCHCFAPRPCFASCNCCHDPSIVRSAQICPPFTGFIQLAHPSRCSRSTLTTVSFCALVFRDHVGFVSFSSLCVHIGSAAIHWIHHGLRHFHLVVECGIHGQ